MKLIFTLLISSFLSIGCSSSSNDPLPSDDSLVDPIPDQEEQDDLTDPLDDVATGKINADNYAEIFGIAEDIGFHTFTREYNLGALAQPFTIYKNELFDAGDFTIDTSTVDDTRDCPISGSTKTTGGISADYADYSLQYEFDDCESNAGTVNGSATYNETLINIATISHDFDLTFTNVEIEGERGDRVLLGKFDSENNQQLSLSATFDVTKYLAEVPGSMLLEVSGSGTYDADTSFDTQDPTGATADSTLTAEFSMTTSTGDGSDRLTVNVKSDLGLASTSDLDIGPPVSGSFTISADDNSQVAISPSDVAGMVNVDLTAADGAVSRDVRSWSELVSVN